MLSKFWVLSLSGKFDDILLWSHYADNHSGICIQYATVEIYDDKKSALFLEFEEGAVNYKSPMKGVPSNFIMAHPVNYEIKMPKPYNVLKQNLSGLSDFITTKHENWQYENEYRIFLPIEDVCQQKAKIYCKCVSGLIFGMKTNKRNVLNVKTFYDSKAKKQEISLSKMVPLDDDYKLKRVYFDSFEELMETIE